MFGTSVITLGGLTLFPYGIGLAAAALAAWGVFVMAARKCDLPKGSAPIFAVLTLPIAFLCSRLLFAAIEWGLFSGDLSGVLRLSSEGGLSMVGAALGFVLAAFLCARVQHVKPAGKWMDAALLSLIAFVCVARLFEGATILCDEYAPYDGLGYGQDVSNTLPGFLSLPFLLIQGEDGAFLRVYLLEALWAFAAFAITAIPYFTSKRLRPGDSALTGGLCLAAGQLLMESLRSDGHMMWGFVHAQQVFCALIAMALLSALAIRERTQNQHRGNQGSRGSAVLVIGLGLLCVLVCLFVEFALDGNQIQIQWVLDLSYGVLYGLFALAVLSMMALGWGSQHRGAKKWNQRG